MAASILDRFEFQEAAERESSNLVELIAQSDWARNLAYKIATRGGLTPGTEEFRRFVDNYSRWVASGFARSIVMRAGAPPPTPSPPAPPARRRRVREITPTE